MHTAIRTPAWRQAAWTVATLAALSASHEAQADVELTDLPGVSTSANSCYLQVCGVPGTFSDRNIIGNSAYLPGTGGNGWSAGDHGTEAHPNWVRVDFGAVYLLSSVSLRFHDNAGAWQGFTNIYELRGSVDASAWLALGSGTLTDLTGNFAALNDSYEWTGDARPAARWLEYRAVGGTHWSALDEIDAMGSLAPVPEPGTWALMVAGGVLTVWSSRRRAAALHTG